ncbi:MAG: YMGG-like glycine zipper-containing protein [Gammaproteobacteria bacterium]
MKNSMIMVLAVLSLNQLTGCAGMSDTQQRTVTGGLGGAAAGSVIGAIAGNAGMGAAIGAGAGLVGGWLYGKHKEAEQRAYNQGRQDAQSHR